MSNSILSKKNPAKSLNVFPFTYTQILHRCSSLYKCNKCDGNCIKTATKTLSKTDILNMNIKLPNKDGYPIHKGLLRIIGFKESLFLMELLNQYFISQQTDKFYDLERQWFECSAKKISQTILKFSYHMQSNFRKKLIILKIIDVCHFLGKGFMFRINSKELKNLMGKADAELLKIHLY